MRSRLRLNPILLGCITIGTFLIIVLSWKGNPNVGEWSWLPEPLIRWADEEENNQIRTAVPFIFLGLVFGAFLLSSKATLLIHWLWAWMALAFVVALAEFGQFFIPTRDLDIMDMLWGIMGAAFGLFFPLMLWKIKQIKD
ncbi:VanZ family protein [Flavobacterium sp. ASW18X]|uniref:VanZ family protein n=1 Tax=Flavobacterium sp. ASW18X TaxID=2572595 RepID=UPI0010AEB43F|nr:VanZ family protein [Flavobacterium sp. ASW18X]TKD65542.1 hypothetical protein FBT53_05340 [Flavobacterium sp. ASW18X]